MSCDEVWPALKECLLAEVSTNIVFNQYRDTAAGIDLPDAARIRTENLRMYLCSVLDTAKVLVLGEAAGPWGSRFSGVPLTGERQLEGFLPITGARSSADTAFLEARRKPPFSSLTANIFWKVMRPYYHSLLCCDVFPFHPHLPNKPLSVRTPTNSELREQGKILEIIIDAVKPIATVSLGHRAEWAASELSLKTRYVTHP